MSQDENYKSAALETAWCYRKIQMKHLEPTILYTIPLTTCVYKPVEKMLSKDPHKLNARSYLRSALELATLSAVTK